VLDDWPQPDPSAPQPHIIASDSSLALRFEVADGRIAVASFPQVLWFCLGLPNDEALSGHPLHAKGLKPYAVHEVLDSTTVAELERRNAGHPARDGRRFLKTAKHYVFTFHDSTLECVVVMSHAASIQTFENPAEATAHWQYQWGISWE